MDGERSTVHRRELLQVLSIYSRASRSYSLWEPSIVFDWATPRRRCVRGLGRGGGILRGELNLLCVRACDSALAPLLSCQEKIAMLSTAATSYACIYSLWVITISCYHGVRIIYHAPLAHV
ncbi:hypothetical protein BDN67DRAFT_573007 [Paxillus ammoniavirescens]|nr:hypothetical protein BDN67DRAFT_573007 [Paxillus ammoniavirescens]